jgi:hypothetical protein
MKNSAKISVVFSFDKEVTGKEANAQKICLGFVSQ